MGFSLLTPAATFQLRPQCFPNKCPTKHGKRLSGFPTVKVKAFYNPIDDPILKEALKEPVAFFGGMFAGFLRLDLNDAPLKDWLNRTVDASGITEEEIDTQSSSIDIGEDAPQQIEIE